MVTCDLAQVKWICSLASLSSSPGNEQLFAKIGSEFARNFNASAWTMALAQQPGSFAGR